MKARLLFITIFLLGARNTHAHNPPKSDEKRMMVVIASYNNERWARWSLQSVLDQDYSNYRVIYVDDCSTDNTYQEARNYIIERGMQDRVVLIHNEERLGSAAGNHYRAIHRFCEPQDVVIILDGDDRLAHRNVMRYLNNVYSDGVTWLTYGQFREFPSGNHGWATAMPANVIAHNAFRAFPAVPTHLRTFYAGLFMNLRKEELMVDGKFLDMTSDAAEMMPMVEMARCGHFKFIPDVLLDYNTTNPISDHCISKTRQRQLDLMIRAQQKRAPINTPFNPSRDYIMWAATIEDWRC